MNLEYEQVAEKLSKCHCEEHFLRRGNLDFIKPEIASLRSQRRLKDFFSDLLDVEFLGTIQDDIGKDVLTAKNARNAERV